MKEIILLVLFVLSMILFAVVVWDHITDNSLSQPDKKNKEDSTDQD